MSVPSASFTHGEPSGVRPAGSSAPSGTLRVQAVFHDVDAQHADQIAAEMVSRAHELANLPEHACDVDVNIELAPPSDPGAGSDDDDDDDDDDDAR